MRRVAIGVDPGVTTGVACFGSDGLEFSYQDDERTALLRLLGYLKTYREAGPDNVQVVAAAVEAPFAGKNVRSSLSVAASGGRAETVMWLGGIEQTPRRPMPSEWRSEIGMQMRRTVLEDGKPKSVRCDREDLEAQGRKIAGEITRRVFTKSGTHEAEAILIAKAEFMLFISRRAMATGQLRER